MLQALMRELEFLKDLKSRQSNIDASQQKYEQHLNKRVLQKKQQIRDDLRNSLDSVQMKIPLMLKQRRKLLKLKVNHAITEPRQDEVSRGSYFNLQSATASRGKSPCLLPTEVPRDSILTQPGSALNMRQAKIQLLISED